MKELQYTVITSLYGCCNVVYCAAAVFLLMNSYKTLFM